MPKEQYISRLNLIGTAIIIFFLVFALGFIYISQIRDELESESRQIQQNEEARLRIDLQQQMVMARGFLDSMRNRTESVLKQQIREQVDQAHEIAMGIYLQEKGRHSDAEIKKLIIEALRPARFFNGKGYYFIDGMDGQCLLLPINPEREGSSLIDNRDDAGHYIMRGLIDAAQAPAGEGYSRYRWFSPDNGKIMREKIAYVRRFEPFNWLIGTGQYVSDVEAVLKDEALQRLRTFRFGGNGKGYMSVLTNDRHILVSPTRPDHEGKSIEDFPPAERQIPNKILDQAFEGDGFLVYDWPSVDENKLSRKLTFVSRMQDWGWVLTTGAPLDSIQAESIQRQNALSQLVQRKIHMTIVILAMGLALALGLGVIFSRLTSRLIGQYQQELERQNENIRHKAEELEHSNADLEQFAYVASHDLREPLRMVTSYMTLLQRRYADRLDKDGLEFLAYARDGAARMDQLILDLLEFSHIERRGNPMTNFSFGHAVGLAVNNLDVAIKENAGTVLCDQSVQDISIYADEHQIVRLLQNLIGNGLKYHAATRPPVIELTARSIENGYEFCVSDNGIGFETQYYNRIFGIFQRLHTRTKYEGTGIGLAVCRKIVERHGGKIWPESTPGQGSRFF